jgi:hypothetical protein
MTMELDDMKQAWQALDQRLTRHDELNFELLKDRKLDHLRRGLRPLVWGQAISIVIGALGALYFAPFWITHRSELAPLFAGLTMHLYCLGLIAFGTVILAQVGRIDYAAPVLAIQHQLLTLRRTYVIGGLLIGLPWWFLSAPLLVVLTDGAIMTNAPSAIWIQLAIGAIGLLATWGFHRWTLQPKHARLARALADGSAGGSIRRAQALADELARFERH